MRRVVINKDGIFISRPGFDALDDSVVRLVEPDYSQLEQHAQGSAGSVHVEGSTAGGWSRHRATFNFPALSYRPMVNFGMSFLSLGPSINKVQYPSYLYSDTSSSTVVPGGRFDIGTNFAWVESYINQNTTISGIFNCIFTVYKSDSGLPV